ncbi:hypothetical protein [Clostridium paraputrificum]|uniref:hypothetical protein n=1 Tax=Clostridium paraputrificum TaxID=29363 RepID=UPI0012B913E3|nr:hypothetical protein [Clostridium paraputrificum]
MDKKEVMLKVLKGRFNYWLLRRINAEKFFETHEPNKCEKYLPLFDQVTQELSEVQKKLEFVLDRKLSDKEMTTGFEI